MKQPVYKNKILNELLSDRTLIDKACPLKAYKISADSLLLPFYYGISAIKELGYSDHYSATAFIEEAMSYREPLLIIKVALSLNAIEKNDIDTALKYKMELEELFNKRSSPNRFYLRIMDAVFSADFFLFRKWYPLLCIKLFIAQNPFVNRAGNEKLQQYRDLAANEGVSRFYIDIFERDCAILANRNLRNLEGQEIEINNSVAYYFNQYINIENSISEKISAINFDSQKIASNIINDDKAGQQISIIDNMNFTNSDGFDEKDIFCNLILYHIFQLIEQYEILLQYKKCLYWCDIAMTLTSNWTKLISIKIEVLKKMKMLKCALGFCNSFITSNPRDSVGYFFRSNIYFLLKENEKALTDAQYCYQMSSDKKLGLIARGFALLNMEDYEKAKGCFETVYSMGNPSFETLRGLGKAYTALDMTVKALECYMKCKRIDPLDLELLYDIADTQFMGGYYHEAKHSCNVCIETNPNFSGPYVILGMIALREENESLALKHFNKTLEYDSKNPYALNEKGFLLFLAGQIDDGLDFIEQAIKEFPEYADAYCYKGIIRSSQNEIDEALECFEEAIKIVPLHVGANLGKANLLLHENKLVEALEIFDYVISFNPHNEEAKKARDIILKIMDLSIELSRDQDGDDYFNEGI